jgi:hypothetical protein
MDFMIKNPVRKRLSINGRTAWYRLVPLEREKFFEAAAVRLDRSD